MSGRGEHGSGGRRSKRIQEKVEDVMEEGDGSDGDDDVDVVERPPTYQGERDEEGEYHGRGKLFWDDDGVIFRGSFNHGEKHGPGKMFFLEEAGNLTAYDSLTGVWERDGLVGEAHYDFVDGRTLVGDFSEGVCNGEAKEYWPLRADNDDDSDDDDDESDEEEEEEEETDVMILTRLIAGDVDDDDDSDDDSDDDDDDDDLSKRKVSFVGPYVNGVRNGPGVEYKEDGGQLHATWVEGKVEGEAKYIFPDGLSTYEGEWRNDRMHAAVFRSPYDVRTKKEQARIFTYDKSDKDHLSHTPLLLSPYEQQYVVARKSTIGKDSGEGLYAVRDLPNDTIVSLYNGVRISHPVCDRRAWALNDNTIELDPTEVIDIPPKYIPLTAYCHTLSHKANHRIPNSVEYCEIDHPRLGYIKALRTVTAVKAGEELAADYGYHEGVGPKWHREMLRREKQDAARVKKEEKRKAALELREEKRKLQSGKKGNKRKDSAAKRRKVTTTTSKK